MSDFEYELYSTTAEGVSWDLKHSLEDTYKKYNMKVLNIKIRGSPKNRYDNLYKEFTASGKVEYTENGQRYTMRLVNCQGFYHTKILEGHVKGSFSKPSKANATNSAGIPAKAWKF